MAGETALCAEVEGVRRAVLRMKGPGDGVRADVAAMRARIAAAKPASGAWEAKLGRGRLLDIELAAQTCALIAGSPARRVEAQLRAGVSAGVLTQGEEDVLLKAYRLCWRLQAGSRLLTDRAVEIGRIGEGGRAFLLRETGEAGTGEAGTVALIARLERVTGAAAAVIDRLLPEGKGEDGPD